MHNHITVIEDKPALLCPPFYTSLFLVFLLGGFQHAFGECVEHTVAGAIADDKIVRK